MWCGKGAVNRCWPCLHANGIVLRQRPEIGKSLEALGIEIGEFQTLVANSFESAGGLGEVRFEVDEFLLAVTKRDHHPTEPGGMRQHRPSGGTTTRRSAAVGSGTV